MNVIILSHWEQFGSVDNLPFLSSEVANIPISGYALAAILKNRFQAFSSASSPC